MNKYISSIVAAAAVVGLTACDDYLNREPEDKLIPENFFTSAANLKAYTLNFYTMFPSHSDNAYELGTFSSDNGTDNQAYRTASTRWVPGEWRVGQGTDNWSFGNVRSLNYFIINTEKAMEAGEVSGDPVEIKQALGEAYFFRAYTYWVTTAALATGLSTMKCFPTIRNISLKPRCVSHDTRWHAIFLPISTRLLPSFLKNRPIKRTV